MALLSGNRRERCCYVTSVLSSQSVADLAHDLTAKASRPPALRMQPWMQAIALRLPERQHLLFRRFRMSFNEGAGPLGQLLLFAVCDSAQFPSNELGYIPHPAFLRIEGQHLVRPTILALEKVANNGRSVCLSRVGLDIGTTVATKITKNEVQILIGRRRERYRTHNMRSHLGRPRSIVVLPRSSQCDRCLRLNPARDPRR
jgi:hypothetical protein